VRININITSRSLRAAALSVGVLALGAVSGCAQRLPEPSAADAARAASQFPGTTVDDLHRGRQRYVQACSSCHGLVDPRRFPSERWPGFVKEMSSRLSLSSTDLADLTRYLVVASEAPRSP
jgi:hypothetical protein